MGTRRLLCLSLLLLGLSSISCQNGSAPDPNDPAPSVNPNPSPSPVPPLSLRFFTFGDWGTGTQSQFDVATAVTDYCQSNGCDFGLLLGDNFYPTGVGSTTDPQWQGKFESIYSGISAPFYVVLGNHDYDGNEQAEVGYSAISPHWRLPARAYSATFPAGSGDPLLEIFVIDSNAFDAAAATALGNALDASNADWKILALHHPIYSNGTHGDDSALINHLLLPVICQKVDAVLSGHDHLFSHLDETADTCPFQQFVVGTGGKDLYPAASDPRAVFSDSSFGFAALEIGETHLRLEFHHSDGALAYAFDLNK
ncbi:MAG: metallophosphoesterase [Deltaproteobacteria bacterium]|nr:metallophosphoesterase [Deltaproteobacteria bacterium]